MDSEMMRVKILGIVGTPIKEGNCQYFLEQALAVAESEGQGVTTELVHLQDYRIEYCTGCEGCLRRVHKLQKKVGMDVIPVPVRDYNCGIKDDMEILHAKMMAADGIILAAPVYIATIPGQVKTFIDRCRTFVHDFRLRGKVAAPLTVAFFRNAGGDTTLQVMALSMMALGLSLVSFGATAVSTKEGLGIPRNPSCGKRGPGWYVHHAGSCKPGGPGRPPDEGRQACPGKGRRGDEIQGMGPHAW